MVMVKKQFSNEVTIPTFLENDFNTSELPIQPSTSVFNFTLSANETESDLQQKDWMFQPLFEIPSSISMENSSPLSIPSLPTMLCKLKIESNVGFQLVISERIHEYQV